MVNKTIDEYIRDYATDYIKRTHEILDKLDLDVISNVGKLLYDAKEAGNMIYFCGNGGSNSIATHFACDFGKGTKFDASKKKYKVMSLDNAAWITAQANDGEKYFINNRFPGTYTHGYDGAFVGQLENFLQEDDIVFAISSSGNSPNVVNALLYAKDNKAKTVAMVGFDGGQSAKIADYTILVPTIKGEYGMVEGIHEVIHHLLYEAARGLELRK